VTDKKESEELREALTVLAKATAQNTELLARIAGAIPEPAPVGQRGMEQAIQLTKDIEACTAAREAEHPVIHAVFGIPFAERFDGKDLPPAAQAPRVGVNALQLRGVAEFQWKAGTINDYVAVRFVESQNDARWVYRTWLATLSNATDRTQGAARHEIAQSPWARRDRHLLSAALKPFGVRNDMGGGAIHQQFTNGGLWGTKLLIAKTIGEFEHLCKTAGGYFERYTRGDPLPSYVLWWDDSGALVNGSLEEAAAVRTGAPATEAAAAPGTPPSGPGARELRESMLQDGGGVGVGPSVPGGRRDRGDPRAVG
jgi:hypothetical protein